MIFVGSNVPSMVASDALYYQNYKQFKTNIEDLERMKKAVFERDYNALSNAMSQS